MSLNSVKLTYGQPMRGGDGLCESLASLYSARQAGITKEDILTTNGGTAANHIVLSALLSPDDHVICQYPTYEPLYQVPKSLGAEVTFWKADPGQKWQLNIDELRTLLKPNTKLIIINNPGNPTGAIVPKPVLEQILDVAEEKNLTVLSDEIFRPLFHSILPSDDDFPPSAINVGYKKVVVTGSLSKPYSLPGIRAGWIASRNKDILEACRRMKQYTTFTVSRLDEAVAAEALSDRCIHALLARNIRLCQTNLELMQGFIEQHNWACSWVKPVAGATAMVKFHKMGKPVHDEDFCAKLQEKAGILLCPASLCFGGNADFRGYVRVGLGADHAGFKAGLEALARFMEEEYDSVSTAPR